MVWQPDDDDAKKPPARTSEPPVVETVEEGMDDDDELVDEALDSAVSEDTAAVKEVPKTKRKPMKMEPETLLKHLLAVYKSGKALRAYCTDKEMSSQRVTLQNAFKNSGLQTLKQQKVPFGERVENLAKEYVGAAESRWYHDTHGNSVITKDEEDYLVSTSAMMAISANGLDKDKVLVLVNDLLHKKGTKDFEDVSMKVVDRIISNKKLQTYKARSLDPKRINAAREEIKNVYFKKIDNFCRLMHDINPVVFPWKSYADVPPDHLYNMDEIGTDTTKHRNGIVIPKEIVALYREIYQATPEGDGKMNIHLSMAVVSRADGE